MGETCAVRQSIGTTPVSKDLLKMKHNIIVKTNYFQVMFSGNK
jgi:hypothetical protein